MGSSPSDPNQRKARTEPSHQDPSKLFLNKIRKNIHPWSVCTYEGCDLHQGRPWLQEMRGGKLTDKDIQGSPMLSDPQANRRHRAATRSGAGVPLQVLPSLKPSEKERLGECEQQIRFGIRSFFIAGQALLEIRDTHLYRASHATFDDYCRDRWEMSRSYAYRLIKAAAVIAQLLPMGNKDFPTSERQVRPLMALPPTSVPSAWANALEKAKGRVPTVKDIEAAVAELLPTHSIRSSDKRRAEAPLLKQLLIRDMHKLSKDIRANNPRRVLEHIEHMRQLIEQYADTDSPAEEGN